MDKMNVVMVTGQYRSGKTRLISRARQAGYYDGTVVGESQSHAPDAERYGDDEVASISFSSICCPTVDDMKQSLINGVEDLRNKLGERKTLDSFFFEPPGNFDPKLAAQAVLDKEVHAQIGATLSLEHVLTLLSAATYPGDSTKLTYDASISIANKIGITFPDGPYVGDVREHVSRLNPSAPVRMIGKNYFGFEFLTEGPKWALSHLTGIPDLQHTDHYKRAFRVINPALSEGEIIDHLERLARTGVIERGKGTLPFSVGRPRAVFDIKGKDLSVEPLGKSSNDPMGYIALFVPDHEEMPAVELSAFTVSDTYKAPQFRPDAPLEDKLAAFSQAYQGSISSFGGTKAKNAIRTPDGQVLASYSPIEEGYRMALEIFSLHDIKRPLRMILVPYNHARLTALKELERDEGNPQTNTRHINFIGLEIASALARSLGEYKGLDYRGLADQHQLLLIRQKGTPSLFHYAKKLGADEVASVPPARYGGGIAPFHVEMAEVAVGDARRYRKSEVLSDLADASRNMQKLHRSLGYVDIANRWERLIN